MVAPASVKNTLNQSIDTAYHADGTGRVKLAIGDKDIGLATHGAWQGVATHANGETFTAGDGVAVVAGLDSSTVRALLVDAIGRLLAVLVPTQGSLTDKSGALAAGATSEVLAAPNASRKYLFVQNVHASEDMWINFGVAAVLDKPSIKIVAGGGFVMEGSYVSTQSVNVIATTVGHKWTAKEG